MKDSERDIEQYLRKEVERLGGVCLKFEPSFWTGAPDRLILLPGGKVAWVELKCSTGRLSQIQLYRHKQLEQLGQQVFVCWSKEQARQIVEGLRP